MLSNFLTRIGLTKKIPNVAFWGKDVDEITTLFHVLKTGQYAKQTASVHPLAEEVRIDTLTFRAGVPSGNEGARLSQRYELSAYDAIVYIVDATDPESLSLSKGELASLLADEAISNPILILTSKSDVSGLLDRRNVVAQELGLEELLPELDQGVALCAYSLSPHPKGYQEGFHWLMQQV